MARFQRRDEGGCMMYVDLDMGVVEAGPTCEAAKL